ncbi:DinB family protein [Novosphingobium profundi]|nr:DinB family protein [Novosphingobium profundi]
MTSNDPQFEARSQASGHPERHAVTCSETVRATSIALARGLNEADATAQSMPDASPVQWPLAHTTWFFAAFVLREALAGYQLFDERWPFFFNSYYEAQGPRLTRSNPGLLTRPTLDAILANRAHIDTTVATVWESAQTPRGPARVGSPARTAASRIAPHRSKALVLLPSSGPHPYRQAIASCTGQSSDHLA